MHKKTVIFGFGQYGKKYIKKCVECKVENIQIIDSDDRLWGNVFMGIPIEEPQKVLPGFAGLVVIAVSDKFRWEIFEQLKNRYHISDGNIRYYTETVVLSKDEIYNLGDMQFQTELSSGGIYTEKELLEILSKDKWNRLEAFFFEGNIGLLTSGFIILKHMIGFFQSIREEMFLF